MTRNKPVTPRALRSEAVSLRKVASAERQLKRAEKPRQTVEKPKKTGTTTGKILNGIVSTASRAIPLVGNFLAPILGDLSEKAGDALQGWVTGSGEYEVAQNSLMDARQVPLEVRNSPEEWTMIRKREYLGDLFSSADVGAFAVTDFSVNPGLESVCPWGRSTASAYREYILSGALVEFESTTSPIAPAGGSNLGTVVGAVEYNSSNIHPFVNESQMENQDHSVSKATSSSWVLPIECAREQTVMSSGLFVRTGPLPNNQPQQFYDHCVFSIGTVGQALASQNLGKIYFVYEIYLRKPTIVAVAREVPTDLFVIDGPINNDALGGVRAPPTFQASPGNSLRGSISRDAANRYDFGPDAPAGDYEVRYYAEAIVTAPGPLTISFASSANVTNVSFVEQTAGGEPTIPPVFSGVYYGGQLQSATGSNFILCFRVRLSSTNAGGWFSFTTVGPPWTGDYASLLISPVSQSAVFVDSFSSHVPRIAPLDASRAQHLEAIDSADNAADMLVALRQFKDFLGHSRQRSRNSDLKQHLPAKLYRKAKNFNFGEVRSIDIDNLVALARDLVAKTARTTTSTNPPDLKALAGYLEAWGVPDVDGAL